MVRAGCADVCGCQACALEGRSEGRHNVGLRDRRAGVDTNDASVVRVIVGGAPSAHGVYPPGDTQRHLPVVFFARCAEDPLAGSPYEGLSIRACRPTLGILGGQLSAACVVL